MWPGTSNEFFQYNLEQCADSEGIRKALDGCSCVGKRPKPYLSDDDDGHGDQRGDETSDEARKYWLLVRVCEVMVVDPAIFDIIDSNQYRWSIGDRVDLRRGMSVSSCSIAEKEQTHGQG